MRAKQADPWSGHSAVADERSAASTQSCSTLAHLQWTLSYPWEKIGGGTPLQPDWHRRATSWRAGRRGSPPWVISLRDVPDRLSWQTLQDAHASAGLNPAFRAGNAFCRHRRYGNRPGLDARFAAKLDRDGADDVSAVARAIRGYLDIIHVHPFADGNARAACTWLSPQVALGICGEPVLDKAEHFSRYRVSVVVGKR